MIATFRYVPIHMQGVRQTAIDVWKVDGVRGFYRGFGTVMLGTIPGRSVSVRWVDHDIFVQVSTGILKLQQHGHTKPHSLPLNVLDSRNQPSISVHVKHDMWLVHSSAQGLHHHCQEQGHCCSCCSYNFAHFRYLMTNPVDFLIKSEAHFR